LQDVPELPADDLQWAEKAYEQELQMVIKMMEKSGGMDKLTLDEAAPKRRKYWLEMAYMRRLMPETLMQEIENESREFKLNKRFPR
jgi:hypothetical protein